MNFKERLLTLLINSKDFRGKYFLIRQTKKILQGDSFLLSKYGVYLKENFQDYTWQLAFKGYPDNIVNEEISLLPKGSCFIDIGANIGLFSLLAGSEIGNNGVVISFEPNPSVFSSLVKNINRNSSDCTFIPLNLALSDTNEMSYLSFDPSHSGVSHLSSESNDSFNNLLVPLTTWQGVSFLQNIIGEREVCIKIDVEGAEEMVLNSLEALLQNDNVSKVIVELDDDYLARFNSTKESIFKLMIGAGFKAKYRSKNTHYDEVFIK